MTGTLGVSDVPMRKVLFSLSDDQGSHVETFIHLYKFGNKYIYQVPDSSASAFQCQDYTHVPLGLVGNDIFITAPYNSVGYSIPLEFFITVSRG